jgi:hypothetical protein
MPAAAYLHPRRSTSTTNPTMKNSKHFYQGQQQFVQPPLFLSETSIFLTSIDTPYDMADENNDQLALQQMFWDEEFQQFLVNSDLQQTSRPPVNVTPQVPNPPSAPVFSDGRMAVSIYPPLPYRQYPTTSNVLPSNSLPAQSAAPLMQPVSTYGASLGYQSDVTPAYTWPEDSLGSPPIDTGFPYGYSSSTSTPMVEVKSETPSTGSLRGEDASYFPQHISALWEPIPLQQSNSRPASHTPGPERSNKSTSQRVSPLGVTQGAKPKHTKRAAACWRCRKYRKPVSQYCCSKPTQALIRAV